MTAPSVRKVTATYGQAGKWWAGGRHGGVDYGTPTGDPVRAMWSGVVTGASWGSAYGTHVVIDHDRLPDGSPGLWAVYAHLSRKNVRPGDRVRAGQIIGRAGATGNVTGPHLHIEVQPQAHWRQGTHRNPRPWIEAQPVSNNFDYKYLGKPSGKLTVGESYTRLDKSRYDPPRSGLEHTLVYLNVEKVSGAGMLRVRIMRADGDATAYHDFPVTAGKTLITYTYFELGDGKPTHVELKCRAGLKSATIGTRYRKVATVVD